jgi:hypothetical protein
MLITGNRLLDALDFLKERVKTLDTQFNAALFRFEDDENKRDPREILAEYEAAQRKIARLMEVQAAYNLQVQVEVQGETMSLQRVLHLVGSAGRVKTLWATAAAPEGQNIYNFGMTRARDKDNEYAKRVIPLEAAQELAESASRRALALKQAIRSGNAREIEMDTPADLFDE